MMPERTEEQPAGSLRPAVFFDRDGTLIRDSGYLCSPDEVELIPGAVALLRGLRSAGFVLVVVSNQSGVGRGWITQEQARSVDHRFRAVLTGHGITLDGVYYCLHAPGANCDCRKPKPGLLLRAAAEFGIDLERSYIIGDKVSDVEAGAAVGCHPILLAHGRQPAETHDGWIVVQDLSKVLNLVVREN
jgi:D,D-heptose 1,7-bisphosphate phosphatase